MGGMRAIEADEHRRRQRRVREEAAARGLSAVLAVSRGTPDRVADALWLTGVATPQPFVPDLGGRWRAAGHVIAIVPVDGPVTVILESEELRSSAVADEVVVAADLVAAAACVLPRARVGVAGSDAMPYEWWTALDATLESADELLLGLRRLKSPAEQRLLIEAGRLGARAMARALEAAAPGRTEAEVAAALAEVLIGEGGALYDIVLSSGAASTTLAAAAPARWTTRRLEAGDLLRIDAYGSVAGYLFDFARTVVVGGAPSDEQADLIDAMRESIRAGIDALRPGVALAEVAQRCEEALAASAHARRHGVPGHLMGGFWGHGVGLGWEPPWVGPDSAEVAEPGLCLALERRAAVPGLGGAQYEDTVLVTPEGARVLTA
jgi:Xaa-Pro aminopeptidase